MALKNATLKKWLICGAAFCAAFNAAAQNAEARATVPLPFYNLHTKQAMVIHHASGKAVSKEINDFMRDHRRNEPANMDSRLFDLLVDLKAAIEKRHPHIKVKFETISAYRAPQTNEMLRSKGGSQATQSRHMHGDAIDIRVPGLTTKELRDIATCLRRGGVGYYAADGFVHVDIDRVRYWPSHDYLATLKCK
jgi:uncharacterized protein YcbK (DUF882 family)